MQRCWLGLAAGPLCWLRMAVGPRVEGYCLLQLAAEPLELLLSYCCPSLAAGHWAQRRCMSLAAAGHRLQRRWMG